VQSQVVSEPVNGAGCSHKRVAEKRSQAKGSSTGLSKDDKVNEPYSRLARDADPRSKDRFLIRPLLIHGFRICQLCAGHPWSLTDTTFHDVKGSGSIGMSDAQRPTALKYLPKSN